MTKPNPSKLWTNSERLEVASWIARRNLDKRTRSIYGPHLSTWHRLQVLATGTAEYLEQRRGYILQEGRFPVHLIEGWSAWSANQFGCHGNEEVIPREQKFIYSTANYPFVLEGAEPYMDKDHQIGALTVTAGYELHTEGRLITRSRNGDELKFFLGDPSPEYMRWLSTTCGITFDGTNPLKVEQISGESVARDLVREFADLNLPIHCGIVREARLRTPTYEVEVEFRRDHDAVSMQFFGARDHGHMNYSKGMRAFDVLTAEDCAQLVAGWVDSYLSTAGGFHPPKDA